MPRLVTDPDGTLTLPARLGVSGPDEWVDRLCRILPPGTGCLAFPQADGFIRLGRIDGEAGSYRLVISDDIEINAADDEGLVNAVASLRQLMPDWVHGPAPLPGAALEVPRLGIQDAPVHRWRGMHLDVARHHVPLDFLYRFVDLLFLHKFNQFHLHLTDDQGWRFESLKWPRLTTVGASRDGTLFPDWETHDGVPHGGYYTQDQLRALVAYAGDRGINIIPEVDIPGHVRAVLAAYPELGDGTGEAGVAPGFGVFTEVLHLDDKAVGFIEDIFEEICGVFDSPVIHIGGDECPKDQWRANPAARRLAEARGLDHVDQLQSWLTGHLRDFLAARGRRIVGWDEILDDGAVDTDTIVMSWRSAEPGQRAAAAGHDVVMAAYDPLYFDYYQSDSPDEPRGMDSLHTWQAVAEFDPLVGVADQARILGVQGQLWSEYLVDTKRVEYMMFPRAAALAQLAWCGPTSAAELEPVLRRHLSRLDGAAVNYRPLGGPHPWQRGGDGRYRRVAGN